MQLPGVAGARGLAARLRDVGYTVEEVRALLGDSVSDELDADGVVPARRQLRGDRSPLATAVRLFLLADPAAAADLDALTGGMPLGGLVEESAGEVRACVELAPYAADDVDWLVAADWPPGRTGRPAAPDHVLGVGGASTMLAQCTVRPAAGRALDVGTGCGIQALHLTQHSAAVVATDVSPRCLDLAAFNAAMNGLDVRFRRGSLFQPVVGQRFDVVVSNPPFVIGSPSTDRHDYRDSGLPGDEVCRRLVGGAADVLAPGGWCQLLANWEIRDGDDWAAGPREWLTGSPLDAWVLQRDVQDPVSYVRTWLRDAGTSSLSDSRYDTWLRELEARGVVGIGFGLVTLRASGRDQPVRRLQHAPQPLVQPVGGDVAAWFDRQDVLAAHPGADLLALPLAVADDVVVDVRYRPGSDDPEAVIVRRETGMAWTGVLDPFGHAVLDRADGITPVGEVVAALATVEGLGATELLAGCVPVLRRLLEEGFLVPGAGPEGHAGTVSGV